MSFPTYAENLSASLKEYADQYLATYPLAAGIAIELKLVASGDSATVTIVRTGPFLHGPAVLARAIARTGQKTRIAGVFKMYPDELTLERLQEISLKGLLAYRNLGLLSAIELGQELLKEGVECKWLRVALRRAGAHKKKKPTR